MKSHLATNYSSRECHWTLLVRLRPTMWQAVIIIPVH